MIFGIGTDVVQQSRIARVYEQYGEHFVERLLMPAEEADFRKYVSKSSLAGIDRAVRFLAMRFAAKESIVKAMGTGFAHGMWIKDSGVASNAWGKPEVIWSERGRALCEKMGIGEGHVTLTDEAGLIVAVAVLMRSPGG